MESVAETRKYAALVSEFDPGHFVFDYFNTLQFLDWRSSWALIRHWNGRSPAS